MGYFVQLYKGILPWSSATEVGMSTSNKLFSISKAMHPAEQAHYLPRREVNKYSHRSGLTGLMVDRNRLGQAYPECNQCRWVVTLESERRYSDSTHCICTSGHPWCISYYLAIDIKEATNRQVLQNPGCCNIVSRILHLHSFERWLKKMGFTPTACTLLSLMSNSELARNRSTWWR